MTISEATVILLRREHKSMADIGRALGKSRNTISSRLQQKTLTVGLASEMLRAIGYKIVVIKADEAVPAGGVEID